MFRRKTGINLPEPAHAKKERAVLSVMEAAKQFDESLAEEIDKSRKVAWRVATVFGLIAFMSVGAVLGLTPLKETKPYLVRVDNNTGVTDVVSVLKTSTDTYGTVLDKYWLSRYVIARESYDWETIDGTAKETKLMSDENVAGEYVAHMNLPLSPLNVLKDNKKIIVKINAVSFIDSSVSNIGQVRFTTIKLPVNGQETGTPDVAHYIATIAYKYVNQPTKEADRLLNPLGFKSTSYKADPESVK